jgi:rhodanese-related sulfurtransferase
MDLNQVDWVKKMGIVPNSIILDVRTIEEYEESHIPNSILVDIQKPEIFMDSIKQMENQKAYFVYCRSGSRSKLACQIMKNNNISKSYNLIGGIIEWNGELEF